MTGRILLGMTLVSTLCALPALAASPDPLTAARAAIFAPAPTVDVQPQAQDVAARGRLQVKSTSIAHCWDGSTRTCTGTSTSAVDSNCSAGQQGYCTGSSGAIYCPACPSSGCSATATCANGTTVSCTGSAGSCFSYNGCYASCDGNYYMCSYIPYECPF